MDDKKPKYTNLEFVKDFWVLFKNHRVGFIFYTLVLTLSTVLDLIPALYTAKIIDFFTGYSGGSLNQFYTYLGILLGVMIIATILRLRSKFYFNILTSRVQKDISISVFNRLMQGDLVWHDKENTGNKMEKIQSGVDAMGQLMDMWINQVLKSIVAVIGVVIIFAFLGLKYALIALAFIAIYLVSEYIWNRIISRKTLGIKIQKEHILGKRFEFSSNINTVKSLGLEKSLNKDVSRKEEKLLLARIDRRKINNIKWMISQLVSVIFYAIFILFVGRDIVLGLLTIGSIVIYVEYVVKIQTALNMVSGQAERIIKGKYSIYRMMDIYKSIPEVCEEGAKNLKVWKKISIKNVAFNYKQEDVLEDFSLEINRGEKIGIVGRSGSGKSTLFKLLLKLYLPKKGMIYFDNTPITALKRESIVNQYSIVPQETEVFNTSFRDNILISNSKRKSSNLYQQALRISQSLPIISKLKAGDQSLIGEKGVRLSGGERQRLGIARSIYRNADIIIFDESTSNLDYATEKNILRAFDRELKDKTLIISAHRLSTLKNVDKIVVMERGRIVENGTYDELLARKGRFYGLWKKQGNWK